MTMKIVPCIVNNHNNTFTKTKKIVFSVGKQGEEYGTDFFRSSHERGTKEKNLSPHEE